MATHYTQEFQEEAVRLVLESKSCLTEMARDLGANTWTLRGWVKKYKDKTRENAPPRVEPLEE